MLNVKAIVTLMNLCSDLKREVSSEYLWFKLRLGLKSDATFKEVVQAIVARTKAKVAEFVNSFKG
ncbi:hypothetical protein [Yersinia ruckeri]|uniref:hypothetical protein n=1 Tax=Yersinia ruckeri TaxID=29486 RepID=UPI0022375293|nr:hypothetical protein [Yersinia ruckeri]MCW6598863.1 hypothetical protein [Yersinia ruckeri]